jgi:hypothetical protein
VLFEHLNVDHVALGPGVTAVFETKWTTQRVTAATSPSDAMLRWARQAEGAADRGPAAHAPPEPDPGPGAVGPAGRTATGWTPGRPGPRRTRRRRRSVDPQAAADRS